jgi:septal ring factor EnvC (AmiA/AmiB activator)
MWRNLGRVLVLLILGIAYVVHADDACELESTYREKLATLRLDHKQKASRIEGVNSRIQELRSQLPLTRDDWEARRQLEEEIDGYLNERRAIYTDLREIRYTLEQTSKQLGEAHRACISSKRRSESPRPRPTLARGGGKAPELRGGAGHCCRKPLACLWLPAPSESRLRRS